MATDIFTLATQLQVLAGGRNPEWVEQVVTADTWDAFTESVPAVATEGEGMRDAVVALLSVSPREDPSKRAARVTITYDGGTTYTVDVNGNAVNTSANTDLATTLSDMAADITADVSTGAGDYVTATVAGTELVLEGKQVDDYTLDVSVSGGSGTIAAVADPRDCAVRLWGLAVDDAGNDRPGWQAVNNGDLGTVDRRGWLERAQVGGVQRLYAEVYELNPVTGDGSTITYTPTIKFGLGELEGSTS